MTKIKLDWIDHVINKFSYVINKLGFKRTSGKVLDWILIRHGVSRNTSPVWLTKNYIEF